MAAPQGFEPRYADPESAVLPLNEGATASASIDFTWLAQKGSIQRCRWIRLCCRFAVDSLRARMRVIVNLHDVLHRELRVALRGREALMSKHLLNGAQVCAFFKQVCAEG